MKIHLIILIAVFTSPCFSENIVQIDRGNTPGRLYIDFDSIIKKEGQVKFWYVLDVYEAHRNRKGTGLKVYGVQELKPLEYYKSNKIELVIHCKKRLSSVFQVKQFEHAAAKGSQINSHIELPKNRKWKKIIKGSSMSLLYPHVCNV